MKLNYSKRIFIFSLIIFIGVLVLDIVFSNLLINKIISINDKVRQLVISSEEREKDLSLRDSISYSVEEREKFDQYFIGAGEGETAEFITYLENLASQYGVKQNIRLVAYEPVPDVSPAEIVNFLRLKFTVTGTWPSVFGFLLAIENLPRVVYINNVFLSSGSEIETSKNQVKNWAGELDFSVIKLTN